MNLNEEWPCTSFFPLIVASLLVIYHTIPCKIGGNRWFSANSWQLFVAGECAAQEVPRSKNMDFKWMNMVHMVIQTRSGNPASQPHSHIFSCFSWIDDKLGLDDYGWIFLKSHVPWCPMVFHVSWLMIPIPLLRGLAIVVTKHSNPKLATVTPAIHDMSLPSVSELTDT